MHNTEVVRVEKLMYFLFNQWMKVYCIISIVCVLHSNFSFSLDYVKAVMSINLDSASPRNLSLFIEGYWIYCDDVYLSLIHRIDIKILKCTWLNWIDLVNDLSKNICISCSSMSFRGQVLVKARCMADLGRVFTQEPFFKSRF